MLEVKVKTPVCGDVYGRFTVLGTFKDEGGGRIYAHVQCACGSPARYVRADTLRNGTSKSCGCLQVESVTKHGNWSNPLFKVWRAMVSRCNNASDKRYNRYGGRGITICDRWHEMDNFIQDMATSYKPGMTLDRINNDGPYSPENCRWATAKQQNRNYSRNVILEHNGKRLCVADWALELGLPCSVLYDRVARGWKSSDVLTKPIKHTTRNHHH